MLKQFKESAIESSDRMVSGIEEKDLDKVKRAAHKGVPSYSIMKLFDCVNIMKTIEIVADTGTDFTMLKENVKQFDEKNQRMLLELDDCMKHLNETRVFPV